MIETQPSWIHVDERATVTDRGNVMAVDDQPANLKLIEDLLRREGYGVRSFPRGRMALTAAGQRPPDLILLDINMPETDGFEVCSRLKADKKLGSIPVIFLSALNGLRRPQLAWRACWQRWSSFRMMLPGAAPDGFCDLIMLLAECRQHAPDVHGVRIAPARRDGWCFSLSVSSVRTTVSPPYFAEHQRNPQE